MIEPFKYGKIIVASTYSPWLADKEFLKYFREIRDYTLVHIIKCYELWTLVNQVKYLKGDMIEVGVWKGGTGALIAKRVQLLNHPATVYLCDTFEGVVKTGIHDPVYKGGEHTVSADYIRELIFKLKIYNTVTLKGIFPDETSYKISLCPIALCHIDVDVYQSAKDVLEWVWPRLLIGGVVVYDDYGGQGTGGVTKHVNEYMDYEDRIIVHNVNGHAIMIKVA